jgi:D-lactate dehydrogenase
MYDIMHFEALGAEAEHLEEATKEAQAKGLLPKDLKYVITPDDLQTYLKAHPDTVLPDIITTKTHSVLPPEYLKGTKKSIITRSAGYDHFESLADVANITSLRNYCVNAVAQTAIKLMYCTCGYLNQYTKNTTTFERNKTTSFFELDKTRVATVYGCGKIGKRVYELLEGNGLTVQAVDLRAKELDKLYDHKVKFVSKEEAIKNSDIIINVMNLTRIKESPLYNVGYFSEEYLRQATKPLYVINVTRGDIAPEHVLLKLYKEGKIKGIGVDVFTNETEFSEALNGRGEFNTEDLKAGKEILDKAMDRSENFYVQPHQGFNSDKAAIEKAKDAIIHVCEWYKNNKEKFDEQLPYYTL